MYPYAQTNIQLFNQLRREGYSDKELSCVHNTYKLAMRLFTGLMQPSGKTFIDHLVGTTSILASLHRSIEVVAAGLLHAVYLYDDFGGLREGTSDAKRQKVRSLVGEEIEEYVFRYSLLRQRWNQQLLVLRDSLEALSPIDRDVLLIRLANELEIYLDLGALYCHNAEMYQQSVARHGPVIIDMANKLGFSALATELARVFEETALGEIPVELRSRINHTIAPKSCCKRLSVRVQHRLIRERNRLRILLHKATKGTAVPLRR